jgi:hypothetical protein
VRPSSRRTVWRSGRFTPHIRGFGLLNLYQWMVFVGGHEARHTAQIREVAVVVKRRLSIATIV